MMGGMERFTRSCDDIFVDGVFRLSQSKSSKPNTRLLSCRGEDFLGFAFRKKTKPLKLKDWLGGLESIEKQIRNPTKDGKN